MPATQRVGQRETRGSLATAPSLAGVCPPENLESPPPVAPAALPGGLASVIPVFRPQRQRGIRASLSHWFPGMPLEGWGEVRPSGSPAMAWPTPRLPASSHVGSQPVCCPFLRSYEPLLFRDQRCKLARHGRHGARSPSMLFPGSSPAAHVLLPKGTFLGIGTKGRGGHGRGRCMWVGTDEQALESHKLLSSQACSWGCQGPPAWLRLRGASVTFHQHGPFFVGVPITL